MHELHFLIKILKAADVRVTDWQRDRYSYSELYEIADLASRSDLSLPSARECRVAIQHGIRRLNERNIAWSTQLQNLDASEQILIRPLHEGVTEEVRIVNGAIQSVTVTKGQGSGFSPAPAAAYVQRDPTPEDERVFLLHRLVTLNAELRNERETVEYLMGAVKRIQNLSADTRRVEAICDEALKGTFPA